MENPHRIVPGLQIIKCQGEDTGTGLEPLPGQRPVTIEISLAFKQRGINFAVVVGDIVYLRLPAGGIISGAR